MSFDVSWDVDKYKSEHESEEHWEFRRQFLVAHKNKYPKDRLLSLAQVFFNVEFLNCKYPQQTMDLIERLSRGVAEDLREKRKGKLQRTFVSMSVAAEIKAKNMYIGGNCKAVTEITKNNEPPTKTFVRKSVAAEIKTKNVYSGGNCKAVTEITKNNEPPTKTIKLSTSGGALSDLQNFILFVGKNEDPFEILNRSCSLSKMPIPSIIFDKSKPGIVHSNLYLKNTLVASGFGPSEKAARKDVARIAYDNLKEICYIIKTKEDDESEFYSNKEGVKSDNTKKADEKELNFNKKDVINNELLPLIQDSAPMLCDNDPDKDNNMPETKVSVDNIGKQILKMMGWTEGTGLGKHGQGRIEPIQVVELPKNMGLGNKSQPVGESAKQKIMFAFKREITKHLMEFMKSQKKRLTFPTEFTTDERRVIHMSGSKLGLRTKSYGCGENRYVVLTKKQTSQEIFEELMNTGHENDYYILIPPKNVGVKC